MNSVLCHSFVSGGGLSVRKEKSISRKRGSDETRSQGKQEMMTSRAQREWLSWERGIPPSLRKACIEAVMV